jgi:hypothetical protein
MQLWLDTKDVQKAVKEYVEKHIIREGQHITSISGGAQVNMCIRDTMEELAK